MPIDTKYYQITGISPKEVIKKLNDWRKTNPSLDPVIHGPIQGMVNEFTENMFWVTFEGKE